MQRFIPNASHFRLCGKKHADKQRNKHLFETKEKEKQTDTGKETETISIILVGPIHVPIHFQGET